IRDLADPWRALQIIESAGVAGMNVTAMLDEASAERTPARATAIARLGEDRAESLAAGKFEWIWWTWDRGDPLGSWLRSETVLAFLRGIFDEHVEHPEAGQWALACDIL